MPELARADPRGRRDLAGPAGWPLPDVDALAARGLRRRAPRPARARAPLRRALTDGSWPATAPAPAPSGSGGRTCRWCCGRCAGRVRPRATELAQRTGLAKATVGAIVADLEAGAGGGRGGVPDRGARAGPGRPVALRGDRFVALGLELNVDYVAGRGPRPDRRGAVRSRPGRCRCDGPGRERRRWSTARSDAVAARPADRGRWSAPRSRSPAWSAATTGPSPGHPTSASPATRWPRGSSGRWAAGARSGSATTPTARRTPRPTTAPRRTARHVLYLTGTVGIGAGIVEDGDLVRGAAGFAGEVGHMPVGDPAARVRLRPARAAGRPRSACTRCSTRWG